MFLSGMRAIGLFEAKVVLYISVRLWSCLIPYPLLLPLHTSRAGCHDACCLSAASQEH
jgi:hypothetical protein